jgi:hypothetical protein
MYYWTLHDCVCGLTKQSIEEFNRRLGFDITFIYIGGGHRAPNYHEGNPFMCMGFNDGKDISRSRFRDFENPAYIILKHDLEKKQTRSGLNY